MLRAVGLRIATLAVATVALFGHGGGLDANGGHNDRKAGNYHFHRGPLAGKTFASKSEALQALSAPAKPRTPPSSTPARPLVEKTAPASAALERTVYITKTGSKYHGPNCSSLRSSRIAVSLKDALGRGLTECAICRGR